LRSEEAISSQHSARGLPRQSFKVSWAWKQKVQKPLPLITVIRVISTDKTKEKSEIAWTGIFSHILSISLRTTLAILKEVLGMGTSKPCHFFLLEKFRH
jgi:hypothetical protein